MHSMKSITEPDSPWLMILITSVFLLFSYSCTCPRIQACHDLSCLSQLHTHTHVDSVSSITCACIHA